MSRLPTFAAVLAVVRELLCEFGIRRCPTCRNVRDKVEGR
jgi:hypothetical protein